MRQEFAMTTVDNLAVLEQVEGGGFWAGVGCGIGIVGTVAAAVSPDPFSKLALITYGGTALSCVCSFRAC